MIKNKNVRLKIQTNYFLSQQDGTWVESSETHLSKPNYTIFDHGGAVGKHR